MNATELFHRNVIRTHSSDSAQFQASKRWFAARGVFVI